MCPASSTAMHDVSLTQRVAVRALKPSISTGAPQLGVAVVAFVDTTALPIPGPIVGAMHIAALAQETALMLALTATPEIQVGSGLPGLVENADAPPPPTATHSETVGHETPVSGGPAGSGAHVPAGLVAAYALPRLSTAAHRAADAQETAVTMLAPAMRLGVHTGRASPGLVVTTTRPASPAPTHSDSDGQETALRTAAAANVVVHTGVSAPGFFETCAEPSPATATHIDTVGQEIPAMGLSMVVRRQEGALAVGSRVTKTWPKLSVATHERRRVGHETAVIGVPIVAGSDQVGLAAPGLVEVTRLPDVVDSSAQRLRRARDRR